MGMDRDRQLWAWTYRQTVMGIYLQIDTYLHGLGIRLGHFDLDLEFGLGLGLSLGLGLGRNWMDLDFQIVTYADGRIDRYLYAWTYRQTLMGMDLQIDTYGHGLIDLHLWAWTYIDTYQHGF